MYERIVVAAVFISVTLAAQTPSADIGQELFSSSCAGCHGLNGRGGEHAPDIVTGTDVRQLTGAAVTGIVQNGIAGTGMPAFGRTFSDEQVGAVVKYVRSLQGQGGSGSSGGDRDHGRALFFGKAKCSECHMMNGMGGFLASDLSTYANGHSAAEIREAIVDPNKNLDPLERAVTVTTREGKRYSGVLRNEDNFSLQMQTADGSFHLFDKAELARVEHSNQSIMPSQYGSELSGAELNDLVGYLVATGGGDTSERRHNEREFKLEAKSPSFRTLIDSEAKLTRVATGFGFTEGPVWDPAGFLYVSDEEQNKIYRVYSDGRKESLIALQDPDGNTFDRKQQLLDCASILRAIILVAETGKYTVLADRFEGHRFNSPNDVVVGPDDAIYFTDPTLDLPKGEKQEIPFQGVYRLGTDGSVRLLVKDMAQPNGLAFSPDGKHLYVDDSERKDIRVFDFSAEANVTNERRFGDENEPGGVPDGMRVDQAGNLYVVGPKGIWVWNAQGNHIGTIVVPEQPANLAWGEEDYSTLYITAAKSVYKIQTKTHGFMPNLK